MLNVLKYVFTSQDRSAPGMRSFKAELTGVRGALAGVKDYANRVGRTMRNIGGGMSAGVPAPLTLLGKHSLSLYDQQVKAEASVQQAIRSTGGAAGKTLASASSLEKDFREKTKGSNADAAAEIGKLVAARAKEAGVEHVIFDRGGYLFHGRVKALAEAAREGGLKF